MSSLDTIRVTRLPSGLRVATDTMPGTESVALGVWVAAGTRHEAPEVNGIAHLLEHMAFKGTRRRSAREIAETIEAVGGYLNAYTSRESTAFYARVLKEDLGLALDILADILQHSTFEEAEIAREREVVLQEIGQALDTPDDIIFDHFQETAFPGQGLGRPVLGRPEIVSELGRGSLVSFLGEHYGPDRLILAAAGGVEHERLLEAAATAFEELPGSRPAAPEPAGYKGGDYREERDLEQAHVLIGFPAISYGDPDYYAFQVLSAIAGGGMSSRLFQEVREVRGLAYSIYSFASCYADGGLFGVYAGTGPERLDELIPTVAGELTGLAAKVEEAEVARARAQLKASVLMGRESTGARAEHLAHQLAAYGRPRSIEEVVELIGAVDASRVESLAERILAGPPTVALLGPVGAAEPYERLAARFG